VIIPAYNEAERLARVLEPLLAAPGVDEIVVVDDGSTDGTASVVRRFAAQCCRIRLIELPENCGKGGAMRWGALNTDAEAILFLDADLIGLQPEHAAALLAPVTAGEAQMTIGVFRGGGWATDLSHFLVAWITGQRAMRRAAFLSLTGIARSRSGVETMITKQARAQGWRVLPVVMHGVTHTMKESKLGPLRGTLARLKMYAEIARSLRERAQPEEELVEVLEPLGAEYREADAVEEV
jgi:glycosyltransferase involved in cell wall biosynthesis